MGRHERVAALARLDAEGLVVGDLACGSGRTVRALLDVPAPAWAPAAVHALDQVSALDDALLADPRVRSRIVDVDAALPWGDAFLDRAVSVNAVEHLADPTGHLADVHRVLRPGGLLVLVHSDWDTALFTSTDDALTRQLVDRFVTAVPHGASARPAARGDGFMGRKLLALAAASGRRGAPWDVLDVTAWADPHRRFDDGSLAWKVATGMLSTAVTSPEEAEEDPAVPGLAARAAGWLEEVRALADAGQFLFCVTDVAVVLRRREA